MQNYKTNCFNSDNLSIKCGDKIINFKKPLVMGILNITPDSFYDGGSYLDEITIVNRATQILSDGAEIIDIGAYSTRPGAKEISTQEEIQRMIPAIKSIRKEFPDAVLSIDTFRAEVAKRVVSDFGACMINDISGGTMDEEMFSTIGELQVPYIMMHIKGTPQNMQENPFYKHLMRDILGFFDSQIKKIKDFGVQDIIIDPGFGFGKTLDHNYEVLAKLQQFNVLGFPVLVGLSRKSMIYKLLGGNPASSLNGTTALNMISLEHGANILRVHDVKEAVECVNLYSKIKSSLQ